MLCMSNESSSSLGTNIRPDLVTARSTEHSFEDAKIAGLTPVSDFNIEGPHLSQRTFQFTSLTRSTANPRRVTPDSTPEYPVT